MKFIKKAAALFFCAALALSVMAVTALAAEDDTAELFVLDNAGHVMALRNPNFRVWLKPASSQATGVESRDNVPGYEIDSDKEVKFELYLAYVGNVYNTGGSEAHKIEGFQFDFFPGSATDTVGNKAATITAVKIFKSTSDDTGSDVFLSDSNLTGGTRYAYSAKGAQANDIEIPSSEGFKLGEITVAFASAKQNDNIFPTLSNLRIMVRDVESPQKPIAKPTGTVDAITDPGTSTNGTTTVPTGMSQATFVTNVSEADSDTDKVVSNIPVIVNPIYTVTLESYTPHSVSGILQRTRTDNDKDKDLVTTTVKYDFSHGSYNSDTYMDGTIPTRLENVEKSGYTLQGWIVSGNAESSKTWAIANPTNWTDKDESYPATTPRTENSKNITMGDNVPTWATEAWSKDSGGSKVVFTLSETANHVGAKPNTMDGINFIKKTAGDYTAFPAGMVGNITLTPVYTRNVYIATFYAQETIGEQVTKAAFNIAGVNVTAAAEGTPVATYTKNYTIEDLYTAADKYATGEAYDFFTLEDKTDGPKGPQGLARTAYKFMGWEVNVGNGSGNYVTSTDKEAYGWSKGLGYNPVQTGANIAEAQRTKILTAKQTKCYGDVTFTAFWEEDVYFAVVPYHYAGKKADDYENSLILVGVPAYAGVDAGNATNNYNSAYTYRCVSKGNVAENMFTVPALLNATTGKADANGTKCQQRANYLAAAVSDANKDHSDFTSAVFASDKNYVIFAYLAADSTKVTDITINEFTESCGNESLNYDGDIDNSQVIDISDFGNVDSLYVNQDASVLGIANRYGVRARLQADVYATDTTNATFGSIGDIVTIYNKLGYNITAT